MEDLLSEVEGSGVKEEEEDPPRAGPGPEFRWGESDWKEEDPVGWKGWRPLLAPEPERSG